MVRMPKTQRIQGADFLSERQVSPTLTAIPLSLAAMLIRGEMSMSHLSTPITTAKLLRHSVGFIPANTNILRALFTSGLVSPGLHWGRMANGEQVVTAK